MQTVTLDGLDGPAGSVGQVRESAARLATFARASRSPVVLVGQVTKDGSLAGPKTLEHLVDAVLALEGDRYGTIRVLRAQKNRFGSTEEIGVFEMLGAGLQSVLDPAIAFLSRADPATSGRTAGSAIAATLEGSRPLLVEVQALVAPAGAGGPRRSASGPAPDRLALLVAVLGRRAGIGLGGDDLYASLAGGLSVAEPALDLPLAHGHRLIEARSADRCGDGRLRRGRAARRAAPGGRPRPAAPGGRPTRVPAGDRAQRRHRTGDGGARRPGGRSRGDPSRGARGGHRGARRSARACRHGGRQMSGVGRSSTLDDVLGSAAA